MPCWHTCAHIQGDYARSKLAKPRKHMKSVTNSPSDTTLSQGNGPSNLIRKATNHAHAQKRSRRTALSGAFADLPSGSWAAHPHRSANRKAATNGSAIMSSMRPLSSTSTNGPARSQPPGCGARRRKWTGSICCGPTISSVHRRRISARQDEVRGCHAARRRCRSTARTFHPGPIGMRGLQKVQESGSPHANPATATLKCRAMRRGRTFTPRINRTP